MRHEAPPHPPPSSVVIYCFSREVNEIKDDDCSLFFLRCICPLQAKACLSIINMVSYGVKSFLPQILCLKLCQFAC